MKYLLAFIALVLFTATPAKSGKQATTAEMFEIALAIYDGDTLVGSPTLRAIAGSEVFMAEQKPDGYAVRATVSRESADSSRYVLNAEVHFANGAEWQRAGTLMIKASLGSTASAQQPTATPRRSRMFTVQATVRAIPGLAPVAYRKPID